MQVCLTAPPCLECHCCKVCCARPLQQSCSFCRRACCCHQCAAFWQCMVLRSALLVTDSFAMLVCRQSYVKLGRIHLHCSAPVHWMPSLAIGTCSTCTMCMHHTEKDALVSCCFNQSAPNVFVRQSQGRIISKITADTGLQGSLFITRVTSPEAQLWFVSALLKDIRACPSTLATLA